MGRRAVGRAGGQAGVRAGGRAGGTEGASDRESDRVSDGGSERGRRGRDGREGKRMERRDGGTEAGRQEAKKHMYAGPGEGEGRRLHEEAVDDRREPGAESPPLQKQPLQPTQQVVVPHPLVTAASTCGPSGFTLLRGGVHPPQAVGVRLAL